MAHFNKILFLGILMPQTFYLLFILRMPDRGVAGLKMAFEKPLLVVNVFGFFNWDCSLGSARLTGSGRFERQIKRPDNLANLGP